MGARGLFQRSLHVFGRLVLGALVIAGGVIVASVGLLLMRSVTDYLQGHPKALPTTPELRALLAELEHASRRMTIGEAALVALPQLNDDMQIYLFDAATVSHSRAGWPIPRDMQRIALWAAIDDVLAGREGRPWPNETGMFLFHGDRMVGFIAANPCDLSVNEAPMLSSQHRFARVECWPLEKRKPVNSRECKPQWNPACTLTIVGAQ